MTRATPALTIPVREAAQALGIGRNTAYDLVRCGRLRAVRVGRRLIVPRREVEAFLEREVGVAFVVPGEGG